ncbi:MAG: hypothetical protein M1826_001586 [Phylliscum demangeonii]|nr:MAG: hypothetical protein M1826_001586 [Phylliscum demangeonii]
MQASSDAFFTVRDRLMSTYCRDVLRQPTPRDLEVIKLGNATAHHGDPVGNATLFERGIRADEMTYLSLYGISRRKVLHHPNARHPPAPGLRQAFDTFVSTFNDGEWPENYLDNPEMALSRAYAQSWKIWRETG